MATALEELILFSQAQEGDKLASSVVYEKYILGNKALWGLIRREVADSTSHQDLLHEIYLRLVHGRADFRAESSLKTYIYQVARRLILEMRRRASAAKRGGSLQVILLDDDSVQNGSDHGSENPYGEVELRWILEKVFREIPESFREALRLRLLEGRSYEEIAVMLRANINTVSTRIHKGKRILIELLNKYGIQGRI